MLYPARWIPDVSAFGADVAPGMVAVKYRGLRHEQGDAGVTCGKEAPEGEERAGL